MICALTCLVSAMIGTVVGFGVGWAWQSIQYRESLERQVNAGQTRAESLRKYQR